MPLFRGIDIRLVAQTGTQNFPEFPAPAYATDQGHIKSTTAPQLSSTESSNHATHDTSFTTVAPDIVEIRKSTNRTSVYVPSLPDTRFSIKWTVLDPPEGVGLFFKLFFNGRLITTWGVGPSEKTSGFVSRALYHESFQDKTYDSDIVVHGRNFYFGRGKYHNLAQDGGVLEVAVFRASKADGDWAPAQVYRTQERYGILSPLSGFQVRPNNLTHSKYSSYDKLSDAYALFQFFYRSWASLEQLNLTPSHFEWLAPGKGSSRKVSTRLLMEMVNGKLPSFLKSPYKKLSKESQSQTSLVGSKPQTQEAMTRPEHIIASQSTYKLPSLSSVSFACENTPNIKELLEVPAPQSLPSMPSRNVELPGNRSPRRVSRPLPLLPKDDNEIEPPQFSTSLSNITPSLHEYTSSPSDDVEVIEVGEAVAMSYTRISSAPVVSSPASRKEFAKSQPHQDKITGGQKSLTARVRRCKSTSPNRTGRRLPKSASFYVRYDKTVAPKEFATDAAVPVSTTAKLTTKSTNKQIPSPEAQFKGFDGSLGNKRPSFKRLRRDSLKPANASVNQTRHPTSDAITIQARPSCVNPAPAATLPISPMSQNAQDPTSTEPDNAATQTDFQTYSQRQRALQIQIEEQLRLMERLRIQVEADDEASGNSSPSQLIPTSEIRNQVVRN